MKFGTHTMEIGDIWEVREVETQRVISRSMIYGFTYDYMGNNLAQIYLFCGPRGPGIGLTAFACPKDLEYYLIARL